MSTATPTRRAIKVSSLATSRQLRAMQLAGHSQARIAAALGVAPRQISELTNRTEAATKVTVHLANQIAALTEQWAHTTGPDSYSYLRDRAADAGWRPMTWWDDHNIHEPEEDDEPDFQLDEFAIELARKGTIKPSVLHPLDFKELLRRMSASTMNVTEIAAYLGVTERTVQRIRAIERAKEREARALTFTIAYLSLWHAAYTRRTAAEPQTEATVLTINITLAAPAQERAAA